MIQDVKSYVNYYVTLNEPIPYKNLLIHPILVKQSIFFDLCYHVLNIDKNNFSKDVQTQVKIIQMNYLDFLLNVVCKQPQEIEEIGLTLGEVYEEKLAMVLALSFDVSTDDIKLYKVDEKNTLIIKDVEINAQEFDEIIKIILYQNVYDYFDEYINPDFKKTVDEYYAIKNKGLVNPDINFKMCALTAMTGISKKDILNMTYLDFEDLFHASLDKMDYEIYKSAELCGNVKFEQPIDHWVYKRKKNRYEDAFVSADKVKDKISNING